MVSEAMLQVCSNGPGTSSSDSQDCIHPVIRQFTFVVRSLHPRSHSVFPFLNHDVDIGTYTWVAELDSCSHFVLRSASCMPIVGGHPRHNVLVGTKCVNCVGLDDEAHARRRLAVGREAFQNLKACEAETWRCKEEVYFDQVD